MQQHLGVRMSGKAVSVREQLAAYFFGVIQLSVVNKNSITVWRIHGLAAALRINDDQAAVDEQCVRIKVVPLCIRSAWGECALHALCGCPEGPGIAFIIDKSADSTHRLFLLYIVPFMFLCVKEGDYVRSGQYAITNWKGKRRLHAA